MLIEAAREVRELAEKLEMFAQNLSIPAVDGTLKLADAVAKVAILMDGKAFRMGVDIWKHGSSSALDITWQIWDGKENIRGATLESAFNAFVAKHRLPPEDSLRLVQHAIETPPKPVEIPF